MGNNGFSISAGYRRIRDMFRRAFAHGGNDREVLLLVVKSALAATLAWVVADTLLQAPSSTFAPFSALLMVQVTVSQSMSQSVRFTIAVVAGVILVALAAPLLGQSIATLAVILLIALIIGRWRRLGQQGAQVAVASVFAYAAFIETSGGSSFTQLLSIAGLVVLGCAIGVLVNLVVFPPMRYRSAEYSISALAHSVADFVAAMGEALPQGAPTTDQTEDWQHRSGQLPNMVSQTRESVEHAAETWRYNPRRLFTKKSPSFAGHRTTVNVIDRATAQLRAITRGLDYAARQAETTQEQEQFLATYAELLDTVAASIRVLGEIDSIEELRNDKRNFDVNLRSGREIAQRLETNFDTHQLDSQETWPIYGGMDTDGHRLIEEFVQGEQELDELMQG